MTKWQFYKICDTDKAAEELREITHHIKKHLAETVCSNYDDFSWGEIMEICKSYAALPPIKFNLDGSEVIIEETSLVELSDITESEFLKLMQTNGHGSEE